jgi:hypothetical protein
MRIVERPAADAICRRDCPLVCMRRFRDFWTGSAKIDKNPHNPHKRELPDSRPNYCPNVGLDY